ncbi:MAG: class I SAM-dependent methyltransferase [Planctomycetota bacterium]|nr:class I SAM-dependent methyltransferase [Planctomycetota bacterium]
MNGHTTQVASAWVERFAPLIPVGGPVLDLACGTGRHTRFLLARGHSVTAVDIAPDSFSDIENIPSLEVIRADLESDTWPLGDRHFAGVIVTNYLWRPLLRSIIDSVAEGGVLIYETFAEGHERFGRPRNPDFLLRPNELLEATTEKLTVIAYEHGEESSPRPAVRQRICATHRPDA